MSCTLPSPHYSLRPIIHLWCKVAILSAATAGLFSIILAVARTPVIQEILPHRDFFYSALVVHVNLSVLFWLLSVIASLWTSTSNHKYVLFSQLAAYLAFLGMSLLIISPFIQGGKPLMNNYIPVLTNLPFFVGLSCFGSAITMQLMVTLLSTHKVTDNLVNIASYSSAVIVLVSLVAFILSHLSLQKLIAGGFNLGGDLEYYYELLFWSGGHILQFAYVQIMTLAWIMLAGKTNFNHKMLGAVLWLNTIVATAAISIHFFFDVGQPEFKQLFTDHMRYLGSLSAIVIASILILSKPSNPSPVLKASMALFFVGGALGVLISGINVTIPAHYHGSIVGITIAFMGVIYLLLPSLTGKHITNKLIAYQSYILATGQFMHILGLAWSGGYGAMRKTLGAVLNIKAQAGMALMGMGALIAVIGGLLFVIITFSAIFAKTIHGEQDNGL